LPRFRAAVAVSNSQAHRLEARMKLGKFIIPLIVLVLFGANVCAAAQSPLELKTFSGGEYEHGILITATAPLSKVTVQEIKVNDGKTKLVDAPKLPATLKHKETLKFGAVGKIEKVWVKTNKGNWNFTVKPKNGK
jgi:hypothetical protein